MRSTAGQALGLALGAGPELYGGGGYHVGQIESYHWLWGGENEACYFLVTAVRVEVPRWSDLSGRAGW